MKTAHSLGIILLSGSILFSCNNAKQSIESEQEAPKMDSPHYLEEAEKGEKIIIYQMMTRLFGNTNTTNKEFGSMAENGVGKFADVNTAALAGIKQLGATHVWYTGIIEHATMVDQTETGIDLDDVDVVKGRAGSPYAIKDYFDVNPYLATNPEQRLQEFQDLIKRTHEAGLKVLIDFVPNHVARSYHSDQNPQGVEDFGASDDTSLAFAPNNNFYYLPGESFVVPAEHNPGGPNKLPTEDGQFAETPAKATGNDVFSATPQNWDWFETVKLNYGVDYQQDRATHFDPIPDTWNKMYKVLEYWAGRGVDGVRCDMAEMVPVEFWHWVIPKIKASYGDDFTFIAEIYNPAQYTNYLDQGQFDYLYDKVQLYDSLKHIIQGKGSVLGLTQVWQDLKGNNNRMLRFLENHDEQRIASPDFAGNAWKGIPMMTVSATWHTGPVLVYFGQEVGEPGAGKEGFQGDDGRTTIFDFWGVPQHQKWVNGGAYDGGALSDEQKNLRSAYATLLNAARTNKALAQGEFFDLQPYNREVAPDDFPEGAYAYMRHFEDESVLAVANFTDQPMVVPVLIPPMVMEKWGLSKGIKTTVTCTNPFTLNNGHLGSGEFTVELPPYGAALIRDLAPAAE